MTWIYGGFLTLLAALLVLDLGVLNRKTHVISAAKALKQAALWVLVAMSFNVAVYYMYEHHTGGLGTRGLAAEGALVRAQAPAGTATPPGPVVGEAPEVPRGAGDRYYPRDGREAVSMFTLGYLLELMLSLDNMMVIAIIMVYFKVPAPFQHRVLFWGIIGAVALRGVMIWLGSELIARFDWIIYVFGAFLLVTALKLLFEKEDKHPDLEKNWTVRLTRRVCRVTPDYHGSRFIVGTPAGLAITPLLLALIVIDVADTIFAVDSIPAIFGVTKDQFLVLTSNCFAILGLRAIYFAIAAITAKFRYLKQSMILILAYIGLKMMLPLLKGVPAAEALIPDWDFHVPSVASLLIIGAIMGVGVLASVALPKPPSPEASPEGK